MYLDGLDTCNCGGLLWEWVILERITCNKQKDAFSSHYKGIKILASKMCHTNTSKQEFEIKELLRPKMKILSLITYPHVVPNP